MQAKYSSGPQTITLPAGVYTLTRAGYDDAGLLGDLDIHDDLTIQGAVTNDRVFQIINNLSGALAVSMSGLTIRNGRAMTVTAQTDTGGAISTNASLALSDVRIEGNTAYQGGGIYIRRNLFAGRVILDLNNVLVEDNSAAHDAYSDGGGLYLYGVDAITMTNITVHANVARGEGGGVWAGVSQ